MRQFTACLLASCATALSWAQAAAPAPAAGSAASAKPESTAPLKLGKVTVSGSFRSRYEMWDWFQPDNGNPTYGFSDSILRLSFSQSFEKLDWQVEVAAPVLLGLPTNPVSSIAAQGPLGVGANYFLANDRQRNAVGLYPKQAFLRFKQKNGFLKVGRFEFLDGSETTPKSATLAAIKTARINMRLVGNFAWTDVGRTFDGTHYAYAKSGSVFTFAGGIADRGVFQVDGWGWNHAAFGYTSFSRNWGHENHEADSRFFVLQYNDWRGVLKTDNRALAARRGDVANIRVTTYGGHSVHAFKTPAGTADLLGWAALQTGDWGVLQHRAYAYFAEGGLQPNVLPRVKPWFRAGFADSSGDRDPNDAKHGTFFQVLPTPRPFARFPFFNMMNNRDVYGLVILRPHKNVTVSSEFHGMRLHSRQDLWYQGGGVFQPWTFGYTGRNGAGAQSLANLYDANLEYRLRPNVTFTGYAAHAQGLAVMRSIYPKGQGANFGYVELLYRF